jgi:hypothetical protein
MSAAVAALSLGLVSAASAAAPAKVDYSAERWGLIRMYEPVPGPQRGVDSWVLLSDLEKAQASKGSIKTVRRLVRTRWLSPGVAGEWRVTTVRYACGKGASQSLGAERFTPGSAPERLKGEPRLTPIMPHFPDGAVYNLACDGPRYDGLVVTGLDAAFAEEARADAAFAQAAADQAALETACTRNVLANDDFAQGHARPVSGSSPPLDIPDWSVDGGTASIDVSAGTVFVALPASAPGTRLTQSGLTLAPGDWLARVDGFSLNGAVTIKAVLGRGGGAQAVGQTVASPRSGSNLLRLHLDGAADSFTVQAAGDPRAQLHVARLCLARAPG